MAERIFIDTNPIIYLLDKVPPFFSKVASYLLEKKRNGAEFYTSTITDAEFMVKPIMENQSEKISLYHSFLHDFGFLTCYITKEIAERSAHIRARHKGVKLADALQLAASIDCACDAFLTNDAQLKQVAEANVVYLGDL